MAKYINAKVLCKWIQVECNPYGSPTLNYDTSVKILNYIDNMNGIEYPPTKSPNCITRWDDYVEGWDNGWRACLDAIYEGGEEYAID